jgi:excisionase family DNA binding protein
MSIAPIADTLTVGQAATLLRLSVHTTYELVRNGGLPCERRGRAIAIRRSDVDACAARRAEAKADRSAKLQQLYARGANVPIYVIGNRDVSALAPVERRDPASYQRKSEHLTWRCPNVGCGQWTMNGAYKVGLCNFCSEPRPV